jgi:signal transduction histidine kinase
MQTTDCSQVNRLEREHQALIEELGILKNPTPLHKTLYLILENVAAVLPQTDFGAVMLWDQSSGLFRPWASYGCDPAVFKRIGLRAGESITGKVYEESKPALIGSQEEAERAMQNMRPGNRAIFERALNRAPKPAFIIAAPIATADQKFGVLVCESFNAVRTFTAVDLPFLQSAGDLMAIAIDRSRLLARAEAIRQTREAEHLRSEMMATLSHELRMPLTTIKGYSTMLLMDEVDWPRSEINEYLELIDEECESMQTMIGSILDSSLIDVNQLPIEPQPLRLPHLAQLVAGEVQRQTSAHRLFVDFASNFPPVNADPRWIKQVFRNILDNAVKYSPNGGFIVLRGEARAEDVIVSIADQGIGISPEDLIPIFEKYFRVRNPHTMNIPGTGLGLPIARAIVEVHGGKIWADSKLGQGTTVYFSLPILNAQAGPAKSALPEGAELQDDENGIK